VGPSHRSSNPRPNTVAGRTVVLSYRAAVLISTVDDLALACSMACLFASVRVDPSVTQFKGGLALGGSSRHLMSPTGELSRSLLSQVPFLLVLYL
jgi:hypothetical protein